MPDLSADGLIELGQRYMRFCELAAYNAPASTGTKAERITHLKSAIIQVDACCRFLTGALRIDWDPDPAQHPINVCRLQIVMRLHERITATERGAYVAPAEEPTQ